MAATAEALFGSRIRPVAQDIAQNTAEPQPQCVSMVEQVLAPDGTPFDIMRGNSDRTRMLRGRCLADMVAVAREVAPEALAMLRRPSLSFEYKSSKAVMDATTPEGRLALARLAIAYDLNEGDYNRAMGIVIRAQQGLPTPLRELGEAFVQDLYDRAMAEGHQSEARNIAAEMLRNYDNIVAPGTAASKYVYSTRVFWKDRAQGKVNGFEQYLESVEAQNRWRLPAHPGFPYSTQ
jgi:hypothetical protein